eukprot:m51a1_g4894 hypothetical protein (440) ;mRNA; f:123536-125858
MQAVTVTLPEDPRTWSASIIDEVEIGDAVRYLVEVRRNDETRYLVRKRYTDFASLNKSLHDQGLGSALPSMPPKCYWPFGPDQAFLTARRTALQSYLATLSSDPRLSQQQDVLRFIAPEQIADPADESVLPHYLPEVAPGVAEADRAFSLLEPAVRKAREALGSLVRVQAVVETHPASEPQLRLSAIDTRPVAASKSMREAVEELEGLTGAVIASPEASAHLRGVVAVARQALAWSTGFLHAEEERLLRTLAKDPALRLIPVEDYELLAGDALDKAPRSGDVAAFFTRSTAPLEELRERVARDCELRSQVGEVVAVQKLMALRTALQRRLDELRETRGKSVSPSAILAALQRRAGEVDALAASVRRGDLRAADVEQQAAEVAADIAQYRAYMAQARAGAAAADAVVDAQIEELANAIGALRLELCEQIGGSTTEGINLV